MSVTMARRLVPLSGAAGVALVIAAFLIGGDTPDIDASTGEVASFYTSNDSDQVLSGALLAYAVFFLAIFFSTVTGALRRAEVDRGASSAVAFAGGILLSGGFLIFAGLSFTLGDAGDSLDPAAAQALNALNEDLFFPVAVGTTLFLFGVGTAVLKTAMFPRWLGWVAIVGGVIGLTPVGFFALAFLGLWVLISSIMMFTRADTTV
jgi:hypothetical protein